MKKILLAVIACVVSTQFVVYANPNEEANKLFVEAYMLVKSAQEIEPKDYAKVSKLYKYINALGKLEEIVTEYPSSDLAVKILLGDAKIESYTITEFKEVVRKMESQAEAQEDIFGCALYLTDAMEPSGLP